MPSLVFASEIVLKNGQKLEGKIVEQTDKYVKFDSGVGMVLTYYADGIDTVDGQKLQMPVVKTSKPVESPIQKVNIQTALPVESEEKASQITSGGKVFQIIDSLARFSYDFDGGQSMDIYFFSNPLTEEQKQEFKTNPYPPHSDFYDEQYKPIVWFTINFKKDTKVCSNNSIESTRIYVPNGNYYGIYNTAIKKLSCSFDNHAMISIGLKDEDKDSKNFWDINISTELIAQTHQTAPVNISITANDVLDTASMDFIGPYLWFFAKNGRIPQTADWEELKTIANQMNPPIDLDKYADVDLTEQPDGSVKVKYRLKSKSLCSELILPKPTPK
jgi:hypothetical protein